MVTLQPTLAMVSHHGGHIFFMNKLGPLHLAFNLLARITDQRGKAVIGQGNGHILFQYQRGGAIRFKNGAVAFFRESMRFLSLFPIGNVVKNQQMARGVINIAGNFVSVNFQVTAVSLTFQQQFHFLGGIVQQQWFGQGQHLGERLPITGRFFQAKDFFCDGVEFKNTAVFIQHHNAVPNTGKNGRIRHGSQLPHLVSEQTQANKSGRNWEEKGGRFKQMPVVKTQHPQTACHPGNEQPQQQHGELPTVKLIGTGQAGGQNQSSGGE